MVGDYQILFDHVYAGGFMMIVVRRIADVVVVHGAGRLAIDNRH